ncbi:MAG: peptidoglycan binding protein CsiV [Candidatus Thiodiazotropha sp. (ex Epidulcina cf. delphinae)]|nr:peptidoglycan binding protein CsiV [Candidatus Thiodiazotropha sp. (ex Epidulcina cf. delphinae)]
MREILDKFAALLLCMLLAYPLALHAEKRQSETSPNWYQFEVLIFERIAAGAGSTEGWPSNPGRPEPQHATRLSRGNPMQESKPVAFRVLPAEERSLNGAWGEMRRSRDYRPLYHIAWRQPATHPDQAQQIYFSLLPENGDQASEMNPPKLEGTLKFGVKRYLHIETDILLHKAVDGITQHSEGDSISFGPRFNSYRLQTSRRMRSGKLHYLDHPVIGVLAIAKHYKIVEPEIVEPPPLPSPQPAEETKEPAQAPPPGG